MKRSILFTLCISFSFIAFSQHNWERTNPGGGGSMNICKVGPTGIVMVGSDLSGAYMSSDHGNSWEVIGHSRGMDATHIAGIGFDPNDEDIMFLGANQGMYRSTDLGQSFIPVMDQGYITDIAISKSNTNFGYALHHETFGYHSNLKIYKTTDHGFNWAPIPTNLPGNLYGLEVIVHPTNHNIVYVLTGAGRWACGPSRVYKSTNGGASWTNISAGYGSVLDFALDPQNPNKLYFTTFNVDCIDFGEDWDPYWNDMFGSLYQSTNSGTSWSEVVNKTGVIWVDYTNTNKIRLLEPRESFPWREETAGTWTSTDGGSSWTHTANAETWNTGYQPDLFNSYQITFNGVNQTLAEDPTNPNRMYWINYQFVYSTENEGTTFAPVHTNNLGNNQWISTGIDNVNMMDIAIGGNNDEKVYIGYFDMGIWRSMNSGSSWQSGNKAQFTPGTWQGNGGNANSIETDPSRPNVVWATMSDAQQGQYNSYLIKSTNSGLKSSWSFSNTNLPTVEVMGISVAPSSTTNNRTLMCTAEGNVYKSTNDGASWSLSLANGGIRFTRFDYFNENIMYAGGEDGLWRSINGGSNWSSIGNSQMTGGGTFWVENGNAAENFKGVFDIETDAINPGWVYVTFHGENRGLFKSTNQGNSWTRILADDFMRCVSVSDENSDIMYATSSSAFEAGGLAPGSNGVYFSSDGGDNWDIVNGDMAWPFAVPVEIAGDYVYVGSVGTGVQKSLIPTNSGGDLTLNLKTILQGPYNGSNMNDHLRQVNAIPNTEPYTQLGYTHTLGGGEALSPSVLNTSGNNAIVDWIMVELRSGTNPTNIIATQSALIQRDGDIVSTNGGTLIFNAISSPSVYVVLRHRNHFGIRSANPYPTNNNINIDFTNLSIPLYGGNDAMKIIGNKRVMWGGNANHDLQINSQDLNTYWRPENGVPYSYFFSKADFDLNGAVNPVDVNEYWRPNNTKVEILD